MAIDTGKRWFAGGPRDPSVELVICIRAVVDRLTRNVQANTAFITDKSGTVIAVSGSPQDADTNALRAFYAQGNSEEMAESLSRTGFVTGTSADDRILHVQLVDQRLLLTVIARRSALGLLHVHVRKAVQELESLLVGVGWMPPPTGTPPSGGAPAAASVFARIETSDLKKLFS